MKRVDVLMVARGFMYLLAGTVLAVVLAGCEATFPIGDDAAYGEAYVGYRLPAARKFSTYDIFGTPELSGRTLRDK